jgi:PAS domain S-box-containing protein
MGTIKPIADNKHTTNTFFRQLTMRKVSLRIKMILGWIIIVIFPLTIIGALFFNYVSASLESMTKEKTERVAENLAGMIKSALQGEMNVITVLAIDPQIIRAVSSGRYNSDIEDKLKKVYAKIGTEFEGIFITDKQGVIRIDAADRQRLGLELGQRNYFQRAKQGIASIEDPVFSKATGKPIVVISVPIFDNNQRFVGIIASTLKIDYLINRIALVRMGKTGYAFMLNDKGLTIAHPNREFILKDEAAKNPGVENLAARMIRQETGTEKYFFRDIKKIASFSPVGMSGWSVAVTQEWTELMASANAIRVFYLMGGFVFLILTTTGIFFYSKNISSPIQKTLSTLNKAIEQSEEIFAIIGLDRNIQFVNPAMERIIGCSAAEMIGQEPVWNNAKGFSPDKIWQLLNQGKVWSGNVVGRNKSGALFDLEVKITPVRDEKGAIISFLEIGRDTTNERRLEAQLRQGQKMEAIGTLAGGIAHDFNNILSAVFGYAELALIPREDQAKTTHYIQGILSAAGRARELVGQILTFSRQTEREYIPIEPRYQIKEALKLLRASIPATIEIQDAVNSNSLMLGDPTQLHQVIMNLCTNAAHAMRENGGVLKVSLDDIIVDEHFAKLHPGIDSGLYLQLKVSDTGCGIAVENQERIFDPFFTTKQKGEGTGLGLSVVHGIVKSFNGYISLYSEQGKGTEFTIYFPIISNTGVHINKSDNITLPMGNERILLIDDEVNITAIEKEMLESLGYSVVVFNESTAALEHFRTAPDAIDVVITDFTMPHMTGLDLVSQLKIIRCDIPVILCSGHFDVSMEKRAEELGIAERLNKPITTIELAQAVRRVIRKQADS